MLSYCLSGAMVAAPTTSLPTAIGDSLNYDYRFCWLRDACITLRAFNELGYQEEGAAFLGWLLHATRLTRPYLQVAYDVFGEIHLGEKELTQFEGYCHSKPVRLGNKVHGQRQLDIYGSVLMAATSFVKYGGQLDRSEKKLLLELGEVICRVWRQGDHSIWEMRGEPKPYTYSKFMCWLGLNCLLQLQKEGYLDASVPRLEKERADIRAAIESQAYRQDINTYSGILKDEMKDASLLMMGIMEYRSPDHPRMQGLFNYLRDTLGAGPHFYRYSLPGKPMPEREATFGLCSFWGVEFRALAGEVDEARRIFEELLTYANDVGLYSEQIDPETGRFLGNFPQAFTHVGLINAANTLLGAEQQEQEK